RGWGRSVVSWGSWRARFPEQELLRGELEAIDAAFSKVDALGEPGAAAVSPSEGVFADREGVFRRGGGEAAALHANVGLEERGALAEVDADPRERRGSGVRERS